MQQKQSVGLCASRPSNDNLQPLCIKVIIKVLQAWTAKHNPVKKNIKLISFHFPCLQPVFYTPPPPTLFLPPGALNRVWQGHRRRVTTPWPQGPIRRKTWGRGTQGNDGQAAIVFPAAFAQRPIGGAQQAKSLTGDFPLSSLQEWDRRIEETFALMSLQLAIGKHIRVLNSEFLRHSALF